MTEHVIVKKQSAWGTWVTPDKAIPVDSWSLDPGAARVERRVSGVGLGLKYNWLGGKLVTGSFEMPGWMSYLGLFLQAAGFTDIVSTLKSTPAYEHGMLINDASQPAGLSVQLKRTAAAASNLLGVMINKLTFNCQAGEPLVMSGDYIAKDEAPTGGTWDHDGSAAPAVIASPAYFASTILPFRFHHAALTIGGTVTFNDTTNIFTISGGTAYTVEMAEVSLDNALDPRLFLNNRTAQNVVAQDRSVTGRLDLDQSTYNAALHDLYRAGTRAAVSLYFNSGTIIASTYDYELEIVLPLADFGNAPLPDIQGGNERRKQSVEFTGLVGTDGYDIAVRLQDDQTSY